MVKSQGDFHFSFGTSTKRSEQPQGDFFARIALQREPWLSDFNAISYVGTFVDYDVPKWFPTSKNFYRSPFSKWPPQYRTNSTLSDFNDFSYVGRLWCPIPDIEKFLPVAIFKMATTIPHKFNIVRFQRPELIPDIEKFLPVSIFKMATTRLQKFNIVRFQR